MANTVFLCFLCFVFFLLWLYFTRWHWSRHLWCFCSVTARLLGLLIPLLYRGEVLLQQTAVWTLYTIATVYNTATNRAHCSHRLQGVFCPAAPEAVLQHHLLTACRLEARVWEGDFWTVWVCCTWGDRVGSVTLLWRWNLDQSSRLSNMSQLLLHRLLPLLHGLELYTEDTKGFVK